MKLLIKGGLIVTGNREGAVLEGHDILVDGARIAAIGRSLAETQAADGADVIDARRSIVMPGLVNAHVHSNESFEQGATDNLPLELWRLNTYPPFGAPKLSEEDHYLRAMLCAIISIKSGVTTVQDDVIAPNRASPDIVGGACRAYRDAGLRAWVTTSLGDVGVVEAHPFLDKLLPADVFRTIVAEPVPSAQAQLDLFRDNHARWHGADGRLQVLLAPRAPQRCTQALLEGTTELSARYNVPVHTHVLETRTQAVGAQLQYGCTLLEHMRRIGMLTPRLTINHGIWLTEGDVELLAGHGVSVTHNPLSNLKLGSGICPLRRLLRAGVNVGLGSDGLTTSDTADMFSVLRLTALLHKVASPDFRDWVSAHEAFRLATLGGARSGLMDAHIGSLEPGKLADIVLLERDNWAFLPLHDPVNQIALSAGSDVVHTSIVNGEVVMRERKLTRINEDDLRTAIAQSAERFRRELHPKMIEAARVVQSTFAEMYGKAMAEPVPATINPALR